VLAIPVNAREKSRERDQEKSGVHRTYVEGNDRKELVERGGNLKPTIVAMLTAKKKEAREH